MIGNPAEELALFDADRVVTVSGSEQHQQALRQWGPGPGEPERFVHAELVPAPIRSGPHAGGRGVEVRLSGQRIGELSAATASEYEPLVMDVIGHGGRPGCEARIVPGRGGLEIELHMPDVRASSQEPTMAIPAARTGWHDQGPAGPPDRGFDSGGYSIAEQGSGYHEPFSDEGGFRRERSFTPLLVAGGVLALLLVIGGVFVTTTSGGRTAASQVPLLPPTSAPRSVEPAPLTVEATTTQAPADDETTTTRARPTQTQAPVAPPPELPVAPPVVPPVAPPVEPPVAPPIPPPVVQPTQDPVPTQPPTTTQAPPDPTCGGLIGPPCPDTPGNPNGAGNPQ